MFELPANTVISCNKCGIIIAVVTERIPLSLFNNVDYSKLHFVEKECGERCDFGCNKCGGVWYDIIRGFHTYSRGWVS
jgi:hypothetical protein